MAQAPHVPTVETNEAVRALKSFGNTSEDIAKYIGISVDTLDKYYGELMHQAMLDANQEVASSLFRKATKGDDVTAQIFWLKTRARWRTADSKAITDSNEGMKEELKALCAKLDEKNKRDY